MRKGIILVLYLLVFTQPMVEIIHSTNTINSLKNSVNYDGNHNLTKRNNHAGIIVESGIWRNSTLQEKISVYIEDLEDIGYSVVISYNNTNTLEEIKSQLKAWYEIYNIVGAVLIGNIPYALYSNNSAESFICELYLMDLDGCWLDSYNQDGIFDTHISTETGDIYPEIFIGRIDATNRTFGRNNCIEEILSLLDRIHLFHNGNLVRKHQALIYTDDSWIAWSNGTSGNLPRIMKSAYKNQTCVFYPSNSTNSEDWLNRISQNFEWCHLSAHSNAEGHTFGENGNEGNISSKSIHDVQPKISFYNLFCCSAGDWRVNDCLALTYLFSSDFTLSVICSTKTGGMITKGCRNFYGSLAKGNSIGESFHKWFLKMDKYIDSYINWFYGMCILGDPFLAILDSAEYKDRIFITILFSLYIVIIFSLNIMNIYRFKKKQKSRGN